MANVIQIKRGSSIPTTAQLSQDGELGYSKTDKSLYINDNNSIINVSGINVANSTSSATLCNDTYEFFYFDTKKCCLAPNITPKMLGIISGKSYTVTYDGTNYTCIARTPQAGIVTLGNLKFISGTDTGEPFLYATQYVSDGITYKSIWVVQGTANTTHTLKVVGIANLVDQLDDKYLLKSNISNGKGSYCVTSGFNNTASGFACIAQGSDNIASNFISHAEGSHTTASGSYSHTEGYHTQATERYASAIGYYSVASGAISNAEGEQTTASGYCSRTFGRENTANGSYSIVEGRGNNTNTEFQHMFGKYGITGTGVRITGWGSSSTHKNIEKLDTSGNLYLKGNVYVNCGDSSTGGTQLALSNHTHSYLPLSGGTLSAATGNILNINASQGSNVWTYYKIGGTSRAAVGYYSGLAFISNETTYARIGVNDSGTPQYWSSSTSSTAKNIAIVSKEYRVASDINFLEGWCLKSGSFYQIIGNFCYFHLIMTTTGIEAKIRVIDGSETSDSWNITWLPEPKHPTQTYPVYGTGVVENINNVGFMAIHACKSGTDEVGVDRGNCIKIFTNYSTAASSSHNTVYGITGIYEVTP